MFIATFVQSAENRPFFFHRVRGSTKNYAPPPPPPASEKLRKFQETIFFNFIYLLERILKIRKNG